MKCERKGCKETATTVWIEPASRRMHPACSEKCAAAIAKTHGIVIPTRPEQPAALADRQFGPLEIRCPEDRHEACIQLEGLLNLTTICGRGIGDQHPGRKRAKAKILTLAEELLGSDFEYEELT